MGMSKEEKALYAKMTAAIDKMSQPQSNPAQDFLTNSAIEGANFLKGGDYRQLPKGQFFNFEMPEEQMRRYRDLTNVGSEGTFALGDNAGSGQAMGIQKQYLQDKFARDASQNYQNNVAGGADNVYQGLQQAAGAKAGNDQAIISGLQSLFQMAPKGFRWSSLLGPALGSAAGIIKAL